MNTESVFGNNRYRFKTNIENYRSSEVSMEQLISIVYNFRFSKENISQYEQPLEDPEITKLRNINNDPEFLKLFNQEELVLVFKALAFNLKHVDAEDLVALGYAPIVTTFAEGVDNENNLIKLLGRNLKLDTIEPTGICAEPGLCAMAKSHLVDFKSIDTVVLVSFSLVEDKLFQCCPNCRKFFTGLLKPETKIIFINQNEGKVNLAGFHTVAQLDAQDKIKQSLTDDVQNQIELEFLTETKRQIMQITFDMAISHAKIIANNKLNITKKTVSNSTKSKQKKEMFPKPPNLYGGVIFESKLKNWNGFDSVVNLGGDLWLYCNKLKVTKGSKATPDAPLAGLDALTSLDESLTPLGVFSIALNETHNKISTNNQWQLCVPSGPLVAHLQSRFEGSNQEVWVATRVGNLKIFMPFSEYLPLPEVKILYDAREDS